MRYEYEDESLKDAYDTEAPMLKRRGDDGWQLCAVVQQYDYREYFFMRPYTKQVE